MPVRRLGALRRPSVLVNAVLGVAIIGGGVWSYTFFVMPAESEAATGTSRTIAAAQGTVTSTVSASGTVQSATTAVADFAASGTVTEIRVKVGAVVKKGEVLAVVDDTAAQRQLTAAKASLEAAEDALDRAEEAGTDTSTAEGQLTQAELAVEEAEETVDGTVLKAPMKGTVIAVNGTVGSSSGGGSSGSTGSPSGSASGGSTSSDAPSSGFVEIADLSKLEVSASVAEADATKLKKGQAATVIWNALPDTRATAKLTAVDPTAASADNAVTYGVTFSLDNIPNGVTPGQTVQVSVTVGQVDNVIHVNPAAITSLGNRHTVTVLENGEQVTRIVEIGLEGDQATEIASGLAAGEQVVLNISPSTITGGTNGGFPGGGGFPPGGRPAGGFPAGGGFPGGGR